MRLIKLLIIITVPLVLIMGAVRFFTLPWYPKWEYSKPTFPADPLGMPDEDRLRLAKACINFLNRPHNITLLEELRFQDNTVVFNQRELSHMVDVKIVYDRLTTFVGVLLLLTLSLVIAKLGGSDLLVFYRSLYLGGILTTLLLIILGVWMLLGFDTLFTAFHGIFFVKGSWLFYTTDSLIRLFPLRFWQDAGIGIAVIVVVCAIGLAVLGWTKAKKLQSKISV